MSNGSRSVHAAGFFLLVTVVMVAAGPSAAAEPAAVTTATLPCVPGEQVALPPAATAGGLPLLTALAQRRSSRDFATDPLPLQVLADLLWAANGVNRPETGKRTAATARNWQNLHVYVVTAAGAFRYDPAGHVLVAVKAGDLRAATGSQEFVATAPLNLVYVSDLTKMPGVDAATDGRFYDGVHAGIVTQNVYLFAASAELVTVVRALVDREALATELGLPDTQRVVLAQSVGLPLVAEP
ncbi:MAG: nitroreductase family protein [Candidatus Krumholzibacteriia bacterium]